MSHHDWTQHGHPDDQIDFDVDLGCGTLKKARDGVDRFYAPGVDYVVDLDSPDVRLPFADSSVESIITHHCLEHIQHLIPLMDECYRVLVDGGPLRIVVPLWPSKAAVIDPDHKRFFAMGTFDYFCGNPGDAPENCWQAGFSVPYTKARFEKGQEICTPLEEGQDPWDSIRELRVTLRARK